MDTMLLKDIPYQRFSANQWGLAPGMTVTLHMTASGRKISGVPALIDTGSEITWVYPRNVNINDTDLERDPEKRERLIGVEVEGQIYYVTCGCRNHPYAGSEHILLGMNVLENWLTTLHGRNHLLSVTHLDSGGATGMAPTRRVEVPPGGEGSDLWKSAAFYQLVYSLAGLVLGLACIVGGIILFAMGIGGSINWIVKAEGFHSQLANAAPGAVLFLVGLLVVWTTRFDILGSKRARQARKGKSTTREQ